MQSIVNVEREVDKILSQFGSMNDHVQKTLNDLIVQLQSFQHDLVSQNTGQLNQLHKRVIEQNVTKIKEILTRISSEHKDLHAAVSKIGKQIDKNFYSEFQCISNEHQFCINLNETNRFTRELDASEQDTSEIQDDMDVDREYSCSRTSVRKKPNSKLSAAKQLELINKIILQHLLRIGSAEIANELVREANLNSSDTMHWPFNELNAIVEALRKKDLEPAMKWATANEEKLRERNSHLLFNLHKLKYIEMLKKVDEIVRKQQSDTNSNEESMVIDEDGGNKQQQFSLKQTLPDMQRELVQYSRNNLQKFSTRHCKEVQQLMGCLAYLRTGLMQSPYQHLFAINIDDVVDMFTREACGLLGLSIESPLTVTFNAGCHALPALINIRQVMRQRQVNGIWNCKDELPIVLDLGRDGQFHSVFACPILREQGKESNPPMRLVCGHVISRDALNKLTNGTKLKCPYCPVEQNPNEARQIYF